MVQPARGGRGMAGLVETDDFRDYVRPARTGRCVAGMPRDTHVWQAVQLADRQGAVSTLSAGADLRLLLQPARK